MDTPSDEHSIPLLAAARWKQIESDVREWALKPILFSFDPSNTNLFSMMELNRSYAKRAVDLIDSVHTLLNDKRIVPAVVVARALVETIAMGCFFIDEMDRLINAGDQVAFDKRLTQFYAGHKYGDTKSVHVMDAIRHLETKDWEYFEYLRSKHPILRWGIEEIKKAANQPDIDEKQLLSFKRNYGDLSEIAHPNGTGTHLFYPDPSNANEGTHKQIHERFSFAPRVAIWQCHHLLTAFEKGELLTDRYKKAFMLT